MKNSIAIAIASLAALNTTNNAEISALIAQHSEMLNKATKPATLAKLTATATTAIKTAIAALPPAPTPLTLTLAPLAIKAANNMPTIAIANLQPFQIITKGNTKQQFLILTTTPNIILANMQKATAPRKLQKDEMQLPLHLHGTLTNETLQTAPTHIKALFQPATATNA